MSFLTFVGMGGWMDLKKELKVGDKIIAVEYGKVFEIKYFVGGNPVVCNGKYDIPLRNFVVYSPVSEVLLCQT